LKNKCCLYVIISIRFFSITICNLLIEFPSYYTFVTRASHADCLNLNMKAWWSFETSRTTCPTTHCHILEDMYLLLPSFCRMNPVFNLWEC